MLVMYLYVSGIDVGHVFVCKVIDVGYAFLCVGYR
jgi:hypothetical protein